MLLTMLNHEGSTKEVWRRYQGGMNLPFCLSSPYILIFTFLSPYLTAEKVNEGMEIVKPAICISFAIPVLIHTLIVAPPAFHKFSRELIITLLFDFRSCRKFEVIKMLQT
jgi:hypothetical protein